MKLVTASYKINKNKKHKTKNVRVFCFENILRHKKDTEFSFSPQNWISTCQNRHSLWYVVFLFSHQYSFEILPIYLPRKARKNAVSQIGYVLSPKNWGDFWAWANCLSIYITPLYKGGEDIKKVEPVLFCSCLPGQLLGNELPKILLCKIVCTRNTTYLI